MVSSHFAGHWLVIRSGRTTFSETSNAPTAVCLAGMGTEGVLMSHTGTISWNHCAPRWRNHLQIENSIPHKQALDGTPGHGPVFGTTLLGKRVSLRSSPSGRQGAKNGERQCPPTLAAARMGPPISWLKWRVRKEGWGTCQVRVRAIPGPKIRTRGTLRYYRVSIPPPGPPAIRAGCLGTRYYDDNTTAFSHSSDRRDPSTSLRAGCEGTHITTIRQTIRHPHLKIEMWGTHMLVCQRGSML